MQFIKHFQVLIMYSLRGVFFFFHWKLTLWKNELEERKIIRVGLSTNVFLGVQGRTKLVDQSPSFFFFFIFFILFSDSYSLSLSFYILLLLIHTVGLNVYVYTLLPSYPSRCWRWFALLALLLPCELQWPYIIFLFAFHRCYSKICERFFIAPTHTFIRYEILSLNNNFSLFANTEK